MWLATELYEVTCVVVLPYFAEKSQDLIQTINLNTMRGQGSQTLYKQYYERSRLPNPNTNNTMRGQGSQTLIQTIL